MKQIFTSLLELNTYFHKNNACTLKQTATQPVYGHGNPRATIVCIGEAPGKNEDLQGIPFIGRSGLFLEQMLNTIKLNRSDIYITNIVKYRPPKNRDPLPQEKDACADWLHAELALIQPQLVIFLGRHSMQHFLPHLTISGAHGKLIKTKIEGIKTEYFLPLFHPAAAIYNPSLKQTLLKDFKKIPLYLKRIARQELQSIE